MEPTPSDRSRPVTATPLAFRVCFTGDVATLVVDGDLDHATAADLADSIAAIRTAGPARIAVDAACVGFMDCGGLRVLLGCAAELSASGGWLRIVRPSPPVARLLHLAEVVDLLRASQDDAFQA